MEGRRDGAHGHPGGVEMLERLGRFAVRRRRWVLIGALIAVVGTLLVLQIIAALTDVSIFSLNLTTALGIGLGIDYSLFMVSRYREEMRAGLGSNEAVVHMVETAGRTVLFSGL